MSYTCSSLLACPTCGSNCNYECDGGICKEVPRDDGLMSNVSKTRGVTSMGSTNLGPLSEIGDKRVEKTRFSPQQDGPDSNAPKLVKLRVCAVPQGITMDNIGNRRYPRVMATIDGRGIVPSDGDYVGPINAPGSNYPCYRFQSGPLSAPGWQFRLDYIIPPGSPGSMNLIPGVHSLLKVNPSDCCVSGGLYGCTDPQANNFNPQSSLDDGTCTYRRISEEGMSANTDGRERIVNRKTERTNDYMNEPTRGFDGEVPIDDGFVSNTYQGFSGLWMTSDH